MQSRDHLQAQMSMSRLNNTYFGNHHCGFGGRSFADAPKKTLFDLPQITWKCPPKFLLNPCWRVAAGEDSEEAKTQKLREARMLDTALPYPYDTCSPDPFDAPADLSDFQVPLIPLIPVEEKEEAIESDVVVPEAASPNLPINDPSVSLPPAPYNEPAIGADVVAAAAAVMTAVMKSKEEGSLIDTELLIKLLSDPQMIQNLMDCHEDIAKMGTLEKMSIESGDSKPKPMSSGCGLTVESKPNPNPNPDPRFENSTHKLEVTARFPGPFPPTSRASIPIPRPNPVSENFTYGQGRSGPASVGKSQQPSPSFPSPKPQAAHVSGPSSPSLPTARPNPVVESFAYGHRGSESVPVVKSQTPPPSFASPKPRVSSPHPNLPPVSIHRFPSPDMGFQLEPFSPKSVTPNLTVTQPKAPSPGLNFLHLPNTAKSANSVVPVKPVPPVKDTNYYKDLIRKHGETRETVVGPDLPRSGKSQVSSLDMQLLSTLKHNQPGQNFPRPLCVYFNSPKGCRNGPKCSFRHDVEAPGSKRMKLSR